VLKERLPAPQAHEGPFLFFAAGCLGDGKPTRANLDSLTSDVSAH